MYFIYWVEGIDQGLYTEIPSLLTMVSICVDHSSDGAEEDMPVVAHHLVKALGSRPAPGEGSVMG